MYLGDSKFNIKQNGINNETKEKKFFMLVFCSLSQKTTKKKSERKLMLCSVFSA